MTLAFAGPGLCHHVDITGRLTCQRSKRNIFIPPQRKLATRTAPLQCALSFGSPLPVVGGLGYVFAANVAYILRRSRLHKRLRPGDVVRMHTARDGMSFKHFVTCLLCWQVFVAFLWPALELACRLKSHASFLYYYPKAAGLGIVMEPLSCMHLPGGKRRKYQVRVDWHQIPINVGPCARNGFRHPPTIRRNLPHVDIPARSIRHWPWRSMSCADCEDCTARNKGAGTTQAAIRKRDKRQKNRNHEEEQRQPLYIKGAGNEVAVGAEATNPKRPELELESAYDS